jgi:hypothetical protein
VDYDGTVAGGDPSVVFAAAAAALAAIKRAGHHLTLFSCRLTPDGAAPFLEDEANRFWQYGEVPGRTRYQWQLVEEMRAALREAGVFDLFDDLWTGPGKPMADVIIDDKAVQPNWALLRAQYGV